jgi:hypothetical protein
MVRPARPARRARAGDSSSWRAPRMASAMERSCSGDAAWSSAPEITVRWRLDAAEQRMEVQGMYSAAVIRRSSRRRRRQASPEWPCTPDAEEDAHLRRRRRGLWRFGGAEIEATAAAPATEGSPQGASVAGSRFRARHCSKTCSMAACPRSVEPVVVPVRARSRAFGTDRHGHASASTFGASMSSGTPTPAAGLPRGRARAVDARRRSSAFVPRCRVAGRRKILSAVLPRYGR